VTGGEVSDQNAFKPLLEMLVGWLRLMLADKGYDGDAVSESLFL
jgi:hypothetical protein